MCRWQLERTLRPVLRDDIHDPTDEVGTNADSVGQIGQHGEARRKQVSYYLDKDSCCWWRRQVKGVLGCPRATMRRLWMNAAS
jgi:hypothetical protein